MKERRRKALSRILGALALTAQLWSLSAQNSGGEAGTGSRSYSRTEVLEVVAAVEQEAEESIARAYAEGFKAGVLEVEPERAMLEAVNLQLKEELEDCKDKRRGSAVLWSAAGLCVGVLAGSVVVMAVD